MPGPYKPRETFPASCSSLRYYASDQSRRAAINNMPAILAHHPTRPAFSSAPDAFDEVAAGGEVVALAPVPDVVGVPVPDAGRRVVSETNAAEFPEAFWHADGILLEAPAMKFTAAHYLPQSSASSFLDGGLEPPTW